jgi:glutamyl-tRNA(Gln) amidotransferase subunit E
MEIDYKRVGLKVGLEIHQQLETQTKLFCSCSPALFKGEPEITFIRRLRPTQSELGQVDPAAFFEFQKGTRICYEADKETSCLVEMDEEPPHPLNMQAVEIVLTAALMMKADPVDEVHVMRKTVIDGSNTTGFQRTCVIAMNGRIMLGEKQIPIQHASLEEDAARKTGDEDKGKLIHYRIDRLGIPLVEIATAPVIHSPKEAQEVALAIGKILRDTGKAMRGLGTIRQDLNISIPDGALVEIKGVQELDLVSRVVEFEVQRQINLLEISTELRRRGLKKEDIKEDFVDITNIFERTKCNVIQEALKKNQKVIAVKLPGFKGLLKKELMPNFRLGTEMADRAKFWGRVGGIFHTDELPAYGVTAKEVAELESAVGSGEEDAVVFVADNSENAADALRAVVLRSQEAIIGVPAETRATKIDGTTRYMRPRPGAARMYPETDIPPSLITNDLVKKIRLNLPKSYEEKFTHLTSQYHLNEKLAKQVLDSDYSDLFEAIAKRSGASATIISVFLTETLKALKREGVQIENVKEDLIMDLFVCLSSGDIAKEALPDLFVWLSENADKSLNEAISTLGLKLLSKAELTKIVENVISENRKTIMQLKKSAFGAMMGIVMKKVRGKADPRLVRELLKEHLK